MLRVAVESAAGLPKKKLGSPDPVASVVFKGKNFSSVSYLTIRQQNTRINYWIF